MTIHLLPSLQSGCKSGFRAVGAGFSAAQSQGHLKPSYQGNSGDLIGFQWDGAGLSGNWNRMHVERLIKFIEQGGNQYALTIGGNSGASNVDSQFTGPGGVHRHLWECNPGQGNSLMIGAMDLTGMLGWSTADANAVVNGILSQNGYLNGAGYDVANQYSQYEGYPAEPWCADCATASQVLHVAGTTPTPPPPPTPHPANDPVQRDLMLTSPYTYGSDVKWVQTQLNKLEGDKLTVDGYYGQQTEAAVVAYQKKRGLSADGVVGPQTSGALSQGLKLEELTLDFGDADTGPAPFDWPTLEDMTSIDPALLAFAA